MIEAEVNDLEETSQHFIGQNQSEIAPQPPSSKTLYANCWRSNNHYRYICSNALKSDPFTN